MFDRTGVNADRSFTLWEYEFPTFLATVTLTLIRWPTYMKFPRVQIWNSYVKAFESYHLTDIHTYIQEQNYTPLCFAGGQKWQKRKPPSIISVTRRLRVCNGGYSTLDTYAVSIHTDTSISVSIDAKWQRKKWMDAWLYLWNFASWDRKVCKWWESVVILDLLVLGLSNWVIAVMQAPSQALYGCCQGWLHDRSSLSNTRLQQNVENHTTCCAAAIKACGDDEEEKKLSLIHIWRCRRRG